MIEKFRRYWKAFFILKNFPEKVVEEIEQQHANLVEAEAQDKDNAAWVKDRQHKKFAVQNHADFKMGLWDFRLERFYTGDGEGQIHERDLKYMTESEKSELLASIGRK